MSFRPLRLKGLLASLCTWVCVVTPAAEIKLPIAGNTKFETTIESVSWMSFDLAPDGKTFVVEVLGELYLLPAQGGEATPLSTGIEFDSQPVYSPDGKRIAFISDRSGSENVWLIDSDGANPKMLSDVDEKAELMSPSWSPDGTHVIVSVGGWEHGTYAIWAYHLDGGKGVKLAPTTTGSAGDSQSYLGGVYSPDGKYLYYAYKDGGFGYNQSLPLWQIRRLELKTSKQVTLTDAVGSAFRPILSPVGIHMVYGTRFDTKTGLRLRNLTTGVDQWLVYPVQRDDQESRYTRDLLPAPVWSADGEEIYFTRDGGLEAISIASKKIRAIDFKIALEMDLEKRMYFPYRIGLGPVRAQLIRGAEVSPDGKRIAFSALAQIHIYDIEKGSSFALTPRNMFATQPTWSPNGRYLAFVDWRGGGGDIWRIRVRSGAQPERITRDRAFYFDPIWALDGKSVLALRASGYERSVIPADYGEGVGTDLVSVSTADRETKFLTHAPNLYEPHYGPEADRIYLYESPGILRRGSSGLISMRLDGTDRQKHLNLTGPGIYNTHEGLPATKMQISQDGRHVLAKQASQLYLLKPLSGDGSTLKTRISKCSIPCKRLTDVGVDDFGFDLVNDQVYWTVGHSFFRRPLSSIFTRDPEKKPVEEQDSEGGQTETEQLQKSKKKPRTAEGLAEVHEAVKQLKIEVYAPRFETSRSLVLRNASIITMRTDEPEVLHNTDILISKGRIDSIGPSLAVNDDVDSLDFQGKYILPGYIDTHAHIPLMRRVVGGQPWALLANLAYGVTTVIDVQPSTVDVLEYEDLVDAGVILGPRVLSTGPGVFSDTTLKSKEDALGVLKRYREHYGVRNTKTYLAGNRQQRQWIIQASQELGLNSTTEGALDMKLDLTYAIDGFTGLEHAVPVIGIHEDVKQLFAFTQIAYTPTLLVSYGGPFGESYFFTEENPRGDQKLARFTPPALLNRLLLRTPWFHPDVHVFKRHASQAKEIVHEGGMVGVGSHGQLNGLGYHWELWALSMGGFSPFEALRAATRHGAEMIGIAQDVGSIEVGKLADLVILNNDPLEEIRATTDIHAVVAHGVIRDGDTLAEQWPNKAAIDLPNWEQPPAP